MKPGRTLLGWGEALGSAIFGGTCCLCRGASRSGLLCAGCDADLPRMPRGGCPRCALPGAQGLSCGRCLAETPAYDATVALYSYDFPADVLLQSLKFRGELALSRLFGERLAALVGPAPGVDLALPVPLHAARLAERGSNQSLEIARALCAKLRVPLQAGACERVRETRAQMGLPWAERRRNMRGAFRCTPGQARSLAGRRVAVVDDVMTTGATLNELAATLKQAGAATVVNWVVARTPEPGRPGQAGTGEGH